MERTNRYTILLHLAGDRLADTVKVAVIAAIADLPVHLRRSLTWDQGNEMAFHTDITRTLGLPIYFCHPQSPWQRPTNENTNGLLRQYFPKGTHGRLPTRGRCRAQHPTPPGPPLGYAARHVQYAPKRPLVA
jgi:transposase, IS30 family